MGAEMCIRDRSLSGIASAQAKAGDKQQSLATFEQAMKVAQNVRNVNFRASALRDIGAAQAKGGLKPQALATLNGQQRQKQLRKKINWIRDLKRVMISKTHRASRLSPS